jgi:SAM-dependent methyltransferase
MIDPKDFELAICDRARHYRVAADIHEEDFIFQFLITNQSFLKREDAVNYYFMDAENSCNKLLGLVATFLEPSVPASDISILEFASGYGCVSRHLVKQRGYRVTPCDIHPAAVAFIDDKIGLKGLVSSHQPEDFKPKETYDVTFALSFFSHMPDITWGRWLRALFDTVKPGGLFIFTTQGRRSGALYFGDPELNDNGYWFRSESEQKDLNVAEYGQTLVTPGYAFQKLSTLSDARPCFYQHAYWWEHQDTYVIRRAKL